MKKLTKILLALFAVCSLGFAAAACDTADNGNSNSNSVSESVSGSESSSDSESDSSGTETEYETITIAQAMELCGEPGNITEGRY